MRRGMWYTVGSAGVALLVALLGSAMVGERGRSGVWVGAGVALAVQLLAFWVLFVWVLPRRWVLAHGLGLMARLLTVGVAAMVLVPRSGMAAAPTLFSLVAVLFATTLIEPVVLKIEPKTRR